MCLEFLFLTRDFYCLSKYINRVKICQTVCSYIKQEKFVKKQSKFFCIDVTSSFAILRKYSLNISIKLVQSLCWFSKYSHSAGNLIYYFSVYFICFVHDCLEGIINIVHWPVLQAVSVILIKFHIFHYSIPMCILCICSDSCCCSDSCSVRRSCYMSLFV